MAPPTTAVSLPRLLRQLSQELFGLSSEVEHLQDTISELLVSASVDPRVIEQAQALDHVLQHMMELGAIVGRAASEASPAWTISARSMLDEVSLSNLARRLAGRDTEQVCSGDLEVF